MRGVILTQTLAGSDVDMREEFREFVLVAYLDRPYGTPAWVSSHDTPWFIADANYDAGR
jgi:hypothetical protein